MPFGRGWFGRGGMGLGRSMGRGRGMGRGMGRGNPYPFCRFYPWLPRRWWAYGGGFNPVSRPGAYTPYPNCGAGTPYPW